MIHRILKSNPDGTTAVETKPCPQCGKTTNMMLDTDRLYEWINGKPIQFCFPEMSVDDREILINGLHPECWNKFVYGDKDAPS